MTKPLHSLLPRNTLARPRTALLQLTAACALAHALAAQIPGDSTRVKLRGGSDWMHGTFLMSDSANAFIRSRGLQVAVSFASVERAQVLRRPNPLLYSLLIGAAAGAGAAAAGARGGDLSPAIIGGTLGGLLFRPRSWTNVHIRPMIPAVTDSTTPSRTRSR